MNEQFSLFVMQHLFHLNICCWLTAIKPLLIFNCMNEVVRLTHVNSNYNFACGIYKSFCALYNYKWILLIYALQQGCLRTKCSPQNDFVWTSDKTKLFVNMNTETYWESFVKHWKMSRMLLSFTNTVPYLCLSDPKWSQTMEPENQILHPAFLMDMTNP